MRLPLLVLAAAALAVASCDKGADGRPAQTQTPATPPPTHDINRVDGARQMGSPSAKVWFVMGSDFQCPYCRAFHHDVWPRIDAEYVRTGKIRVAFMNHPMPFHPLAVPAAEAAMCAGAQDRFWAMHDSLFANQDKWVKGDNPAAIFESFAVGIGLQMDAWKNCMTTHATRMAIEGDFLRTSQAGITGTPGFVIGDSLAIVGLAPYRDYQKAIDAALARAAR